MATNYYDKLVDLVKGIHPDTGILGKVAGDGKPVAIDPGDFANADIYMAAPIAYDLWYLHKRVNFLDSGYYEDIQDYYDINLAFLADKLTGLKPLKALAEPEDLIGTQIKNIYNQVVKTEWRNAAQPFVNLMFYELWLEGFGMRFPSSGPGNGAQINDYCGYFTFPMGQLGVMEVVSILQETALRDEDNIDDDIYPEIQVPGDMFPPAELSGENKCYGRHVIESAYVVPDAELQKVEIHAARMDEFTQAQSAEDKNNGKELDRRMAWTRYWIRKEDTLPVPGEFLGILARPLGVPPHVWWFQESSPFLFAGNWFDTHNLTSGVVTKITLEEDRIDSGTGRLYDIMLHGYEVVEVPGSDFFEYSVGDRVGVLKIDTVDIPAETSTFGSLKIAPISGSDYMILPIEFYQTEE